MVSLQENIEKANKVVNDLDTELTFGSWGADHVQRDDNSGEVKQPVALDDSKKRHRGRLPRFKTNIDMMESLDEFFEGPEVVNNDDRLRSPQNEYGIATGSGNAGSKTPRVFTRSFDELENSIKNLRLHHVNLSADDDPDAESAVKVKDFALRTPCLLPSPATLLERREALYARESTWEHRLIGGQVVQSRRPYDRNRAQTVDERGGGLEAWLAEPPSPERAMERAGSIRSRVLHRQQTL